MWNIGDRGWSIFVADEAKVVEVEITAMLYNGLAHVKIGSNEYRCSRDSIFWTREQAEFELLLLTSPNSNWIKEGF